MSISLIRRHIPGYNFVGDTATGLTFRWGSGPAEDPAMAPWPELADISISNYCTGGCTYCYRDSRPDGGCMCPEEYALLLRQLRHPEHGSVFQVALGGGEPLLHPDFVRILETTREQGVIPNYTTSGRYFTPDIIQATAAHCGAVAISHDPSRLDPTPRQLRRLGEELAAAGIKANIHYVLSRWSLPRAMELLEGRHDELYEPFNAIVFLTYKPAGRASRDGVLRPGPQLEHFLKLLAAPQRLTALRLGVDACLSPLLLREGTLDATFFDSCEAGFFSVYIDEGLNVAPCSFCNDPAHAYSLREHSLEEIWTEKFGPYRARAAGNCDEQRGCAAVCRGTCPFYPELFLCGCFAGPKNIL